MTLPLHTATRYVQPLREGGSLPAVVDTDGGLFVVKFRGAGQGPRALLAELAAGMLARHAGLPVAELALIDIGPSFGRAEPDPEIQEILRASHGPNVGLRYLDGAFNFDGLAAAECIDERFASDLVWFDAFVTNPDRTHRNPNLLIWQRSPWLIDHGAALYAHHSWEDTDSARTRTAFPLIRDHVLLARASDIHGADERMVARLTDDVIDDVVAALPEALLMDPVTAGEFATADEARDRYRRYLMERIEAPRAFVAEAVSAREKRMSEPVQRRQARR
ncbi:MAG TPA: HipA family kinase [Longimicrobiales bacterium]|nr:HipA family kinase [Longimicrobiales bacterium]